MVATLQDSEARGLADGGHQSGGQTVGKGSKAVSRDAWALKNEPRPGRAAAKLAAHHSDPTPQRTKAAFHFPRQSTQSLCCIWRGAYSTERRSQTRRGRYVGSHSEQGRLLNWTSGVKLRPERKLDWDQRKRSQSRGTLFRATGPLRKLRGKQQLGLCN